MTSIPPPPTRTKIRLGPGLWALFRFLPVLSWSAGATAVGLASAVGAVGWRPTFVLDGFLIGASTALLQGFVAHGLNDLEDWRSGTDLLSPGLLSGGSRVIPRSLLSLRQIAKAALGAAILGLVAASTLYVRHGPEVIGVAAVGFWAAVAYSRPPLRLAYRPFAGELLAGFPAVVAIIAGTHAVLAGPPGAGVWAAATLQALISVAWVMQHHLPDVPADLRAKPPKLTTPAWLALRRGQPAARLVAVSYFLAAATASSILGVILHPLFWGSAALAALGAREAYLTRATSVTDITGRQLRMIALSGAHCALLILGFLYGDLAG
jgi:1,4-dihydroxy-2-naphthoate octaprenyltransferase